jgi:hypothetical protein
MTSLSALLINNLSNQKDPWREAGDLFIDHEYKI